LLQDIEKEERIYSQHEENQLHNTPDVLKELIT